VPQFFREFERKPELGCHDHHLASTIFSTSDEVSAFATGFRHRNFVTLIFVTAPRPVLAL